MPVTLSMNVVQNSVDNTNNRSIVTVTVTAHYTGGSFNRNDPPLTVTLDSVSDTVNVDFNASEKTSGSETIYHKQWYVGHNSDGSKTLYYSASYVTGVSSGTVTASGSLVLSPTTGGSGGNTGGDTGGGNTGGGDSGGDSGGSSGGGDIVYEPSTIYVNYLLPPNAYVSVYCDGESYYADVTSSEQRSYTFRKNTLVEFEFKANPGYTLKDCMCDGYAVENNKASIRSLSGSNFYLTLTCTIVSNSTGEEIKGDPGDDDGGDTVVIPITGGVFYIDNMSKMAEYECYIDNGTSWDLIGAPSGGSSGGSGGSSGGSAQTISGSFTLSNFEAFVESDFVPDIVIIGKDGAQCAFVPNKDGTETNSAFWAGTNNVGYELFDCFVAVEPTGFYARIIPCDLDWNEYNVALNFTYKAVKYT